MKWRVSLRTGGVMATFGIRSDPNCSTNSEERSGTSRGSHDCHPPEGPKPARLMPRMMREFARFDRNGQHILPRW